MSKGNGESPDMGMAPNPRHIGRRELLAVTAAVAVLLPEAASAAAAVPENASAAARPAAEPTLQELQEAVDDWAEPWVWRPHDWPGQQLHLNVVEHASPAAVFGDAISDPQGVVQADVGNVLFSYNGTSPGSVRPR